MKNFIIITVGNAIIDLFLSIHDANVSCRLNKEACELCVKFGEKIELDRYDMMIGGNATNAAVSFARFGFPVSLVAEVGDDEFAHTIHKTLESEGVDTSQIILRQGARSSMTVGINFQKERTLFVGHVPRRHDFVFDEIQTEWVYLTSLGNEWESAYSSVVNYVQKTGAKLAFNPGTLQIAAGYEAIKSALQVTDILFLNKEEGEKIVNSARVANDPPAGGRVAHAKEQKTNTSNFNPANSHSENFVGSPHFLALKELLVQLQKMGPKHVVITDGKNGSYAIDEKREVWFLDVFPATVVEKTGAGDAYASGFVSGILSGVSIMEAMCWGTANSASVITKIGAQRGLLGKKDMQEILERNKAIQARQL